MIEDFELRRCQRFQGHQGFSSGNFIVWKHFQKLYSLLIIYHIEFVFTSSLSLNPTRPVYGYFPGKVFLPPIIFDGGTFDGKPHCSFSEKYEIRKQIFKVV